MKQEVVILTTWKGQIYEIDMKYEDFLTFEMELKANGQDGFNSKKYREFIKFASIENKKGKTKYLALEQPKKEFKEMTPEQRKEFDEFKKNILEKTYEGRKKNFNEERKKILENLARREEYFGLDTTLSKIEQFNLLKVKGQISI